MTECPAERTLSSWQLRHLGKDPETLDLSLHRACVFLSSFISPQVSRLQVCVKIKCCQKETLPPKALVPFTQGRTPVKELWASLKCWEIPPQSFEITFTRGQMLSFSRNLKRLLGQVGQVFLDPVKILPLKKKYSSLPLKSMSHSLMENTIHSKVPSTADRRKGRDERHCPCLHVAHSLVSQYFE